jgi:formylglycine-generating enzyme required for sulfatase activity
MEKYSHKNNFNANPYLIHKPLNLSIMKKIIYLLTITTLLSAVIFSCKDKISITDIKIDKESLKLAVGETTTLTANLLPYDATDKMNWTSSDNSVASVKSDNNDVTVSRCLVTAKQKGTAIITVSTKDGKHKASCSIKVISGEPELILVESGTFSRRNIYDTIPPHQQHLVTISSFKIAKYPVTQEQWEAIMKNNPSYWKGENHPVTGVSWNDAQAFIKKLNETTCKSYRLPTEAEWEFAARGGNKTHGYWYSGSNNVDSVAWYDKNSNKTLQPVGMKAPNELGIYDMSGNIWELCSDWYAWDYLTIPQTNPTGPETGSYRVVRGGSYYDNYLGCWVEWRGWGLPSSGGASGFRLVHP